MYGTRFFYRHVAADAANSTIFAMRNPAASTVTVWIARIVLTAGFDGVSALAALGIGYRKFSGADPTGGTSPARENYYSTNVPTSKILDANIKDAGGGGGVVVLTMAGVTFRGYLHELVIPATAGTALSHVLDLPRDGLRLDPGEGLAIGNTIAAVIGQEGSGSIWWDELSK